MVYGKKEVDIMAKKYICGRCGEAVLGKASYITRDNFPICGDCLEKYRIRTLKSLDEILAMRPVTRVLNAKPVTPTVNPSAAAAQNSTVRSEVVKPLEKKKSKDPFVGDFEDYNELDFAHAVFEDEDIDPYEIENRKLEKLKKEAERRAKIYAEPEKVVEPAFIPPTVEEPEIVVKPVVKAPVRQHIVEEPKIVEKPVVKEPERMPFVEEPTFVAQTPVFEPQKTYYQEEPEIVVQPVVKEVVVPVRPVVKEPVIKQPEVVVETVVEKEAEVVDYEQLAADLERFGKLAEKGLLSEEEFASIKASLLKKML